MAAIAFRMEVGDSLALPEGNDSRHLWRVVRRHRKGYRLASQVTGGEKDWTHDQIYDAHSAGQMEHWPCNLQALDAKIADLLRTDFEAWSPRHRFEAEAREAYVVRVATLRDRGVQMKVALVRAATVVTVTYQKKWLLEEQRIIAVEEATKIRVARKARSTHLASAAKTEAFKLDWSAIRKWYHRWDVAGRDIRSLLSHYHLRGRQKPWHTCKLSEQTDDNNPLCVYGAMAKIGRDYWMKAPRPTKSYCYRKLRELCGEKGFDLVSETAFNTFIRDYFTAYEEHRARYGARHAYLKYHIFRLRALPNRALEEVEVDHCLLDVFAKDERGRVARPWLTALICRATKMILGIHISFDVPNYMTLSRAIIHAISPKDLSGHPDIKNDWPTQGVFDLLITDRGMEFLSASIQRAGKDLRFAIVNLPGRMPYLKATVERFFGSFGVQVLTHLEGSTLSKTDQYYNPQARARYSLNEIVAKTVKWIVDDYHQTPHDALTTTPAKRWNELINDPVTGGVRPVPNLSRLTMLMGERISRKISNIGIQFDNNIYASYELAQLRKRRGGLTDKFEILADPVDRGYLWVLDKVEKRWFIVPAVNQKIAGGLNRFAMRIVMRMARQIAGKGEEITDAIMIEARERCEREAMTAKSRSALRFLCNGALATNVAGNNNMLAFLSGPMDGAPPADCEQGELFAEIETLTRAPEPEVIPEIDYSELPDEPAKPTKKASKKLVGSSAARPQTEAAASTQHAQNGELATMERAPEPEPEKASKGIESLHALLDRRSASRTSL